jgi:uncharacterized membrane protein
LTATPPQAQYLPVAAGGQLAPHDFSEPSRRAVWLFAFAHFLLLGVAASVRHLSGHSHFYDLGVMDNIVWQTLHGRLFFYPQYEMSYFGDHFAPILFLFVPLYALWAHPVVLIGGQALALASGGLFVHRIALLHLAPDRAGSSLEASQARRATWALTVLYALHPSLLYVAMFDFHPVALMIPLSLAAYYCYITRTTLWLVVSLALLAACQEEAAITVAAFGLYILAFGRTTSERWIGAATSTAAALYFILVMKVIIPAFQPHAATAGWTYVSRYAHLGGSMSEILRTLALHPLDAFLASFEPYKLATLAWLLLPLGLLPLLGWRALLVALPSLGYTYLSARPNQFVIQHQYFSPALGWLVIAAVQGLALWVGLWPRRGTDPALRRRRVAVALPLAIALLATIAIDAARRPIKPSFFRRHPYHVELQELRRIIGPDSSLSVTNSLAPTFAHRRQFVLALDFTLNRELNAALGLPDYRDTKFHLFDLTNLGGSQDRERRVAQLLADERYGVRYYRFPLVLFERGLPRQSQPELEALVAGEGDGDDGPGLVRVFPAVFLQIRDARSVERDLGIAGHDAKLRFVPGRRGEAYGPRVRFPAGAYAVDFHLRLDAPVLGPVADLRVVSGNARRRHAGRRVSGEAFSADRGCQPFSLLIELEAETSDLEFRTYSDGAAFSLCKVVVRQPS